MKLKKTILILGIATFGFLSFKAVDDYFEVSKNLDIFASVYKEVNTAYVDEVKPGELIRAAIDGMLASLDPYTNFYSEAQAEDYRYQVTGTYAGIGTSVVGMDGKVVINIPHEGMPAQKAGLLPGDIILEVDGKSMNGLNTEEVVEYLKGNAGTSIALLIDRPNVGEKTFTISREQIKLKNVPYYSLLDDGLGYIQLTGFTPGAGKEVRDAVIALKGQGATSYVLDLRGNGGGLLHEAINIVNVFVKKGETIVITKGRLKEENRTYKTLNSPIDTESPLAVLIDNGSASASEIVSGSLQDLDRAVLIGQNSFGKGLVQSSKQLTYNSQMKITIAKYYIPSGRLIQRLDYGNKVNGKAIAVADSMKREFYTRNKRPVVDGEGVQPDIEVEYDDYSKVSKSLNANHHIFNYATLYRTKHESIPTSRKFDISDEDYADFVRYVDDREYQYTSETEKLLEKLKKASKEERFDQLINDDLEKLENEVIEHKTNDLETYKAEIKEMLEYEIARRYYFETGQIEITFDDDNELKKAFEILANKSELARILGN